jgi:hypothetical protein
MAQPAPYDRQVSFALFSAENPSKPPNGINLDTEFNAVKVSLDETQANLKMLQADDGRLAPGSVGREQLDSSITIGFESPEPWAPNTNYTVDISTVFNEAIFYTAAETHTSGATFDPAKWRLVADLSVAAALPDGGVTEAKLADGSVTASKIATNAVSQSKIASNSITNAKIADQTIEFAKFAADTPADIRDAILPAGLGPFPHSLPDLPAGWDWADGGVLLSNTAFPNLRQAYIAAGFPHGQDGSGNPKKPDCKGRSVFGKDNMGGGAAGRLTSAGSGVDGLTLGATGGHETATLSTSNLPPYTPAGGVTNGAITSTATVGGNPALGGNGAFIVLNSGNGVFVPYTGNGVNGISVASSQAPSTFAGTAQGGTSAPVATVPPALVCNMIIKAH